MRAMSGGDPNYPPSPGWWLASDGRWYPPQPPAPGWWLASDGRWYPPQQPTYGPPPPAPAQQKSNKGCLTVVAIVGVFLLLCGGAATFVVVKVLDEVNVGDVECPSEGDVSDLIGYDVDLDASDNFVIVGSCTYSSNDPTGGADVEITVSNDVVADELLDEVETAARGAGAEPTPIDVGDDGVAYGSDTRSEAATKADGKVIQVEIASAGVDPIGNKQSEAVELLETFIDLNY